MSGAAPVETSAARTARLRRKCEGAFMDVLRLDVYESLEFIKWAHNQLRMQEVPANVTS